MLTDRITCKCNQKHNLWQEYGKMLPDLNYLHPAVTLIYTDRLSLKTKVMQTLHTFLVKNCCKMIFDSKACWPLMYLLIELVLCINDIIFSLIFLKPDRKSSKVWLLSHPIRCVATISITNGNIVTCLTWMQLQTLLFNVLILFWETMEWEPHAREPHARAIHETV